MNTDRERAAVIMRALGSAVRIEILVYLLENNEVRVRELEAIIALTEASISYNLRILCEAGLLDHAGVTHTRRYFVRNRKWVRQLLEMF